MATEREKGDYYGPCDRAIQDMNRVSVRLFGQLKLAKFDELHIIRDVTKVYTRLLKESKQRLYEVSFEAYLLGLALCEIKGEKAHRMAEKAIDREWVERLVNEPDFVTGYEFEAETERKKQRLIEGLASVALVMSAGGDLREAVGPGGTDTSGGTDARIEKALRDWSRMFGQEAISATDSAVTEAMDDAEIVNVMWVSQNDQRVCTECHRLDGQIFPLDAVPPKPHWGCRCRIRPVG